jgi:hypothetical protein
MRRTSTSSKTARTLGAGLLALCTATALLGGTAAASARDSDGDGMPNSWEVNQGLDPHKANGGGNPDHDGLKNLSEYKNGAEPKDEDTDNDGLDDGDEVKDYENYDVDDSDSNDNGVEDGDQDVDGDKQDNEDEDDSQESCRADDDDSDKDGLDDEDENDFGTKAGDSDSDDDGIEDGNEDSDDDDVNDEDSDDDDGDDCEDDGEDRDDVVGTIGSFDSETGVLTIRVGAATISGPVTEETEIEYDSSGPGSGEEASTADLVSGTGITDFDLEDNGEFEEIELAQTIERDDA